MTQESKHSVKSNFPRTSAEILAELQRGQERMNGIITGILIACTGNFLALIGVMISLWGR